MNTTNQELRELQRAGGPCFVCDRPLARHSLARLRRCVTTPLNLRITDKGRARIRR